MSEDKTIHSGGGTRRGLYIAIAVIAVFVLGMAMLGSASRPATDGAPAAESSDSGS